MTTVYIVLFIVAGFAVLVLTFASASKLAGHIRPFVGIGLLIAPIVTFMLDFAVWAIAESLLTVAFFLFYPDDQVRGILAPIVVLIGCLPVSLVLILLPAISFWAWLSITENLGETDLLWSILLGGGATFAIILGVYLAYKGIRHLGPKMRVAVRVLGRNV